MTHDEEDVGPQGGDGYPESQFSGHASVLISKIVAEHRELQRLKLGEYVSIDGTTLSIASVVAVARYLAHAKLDESPDTRQHVDNSRACVDTILAERRSVYGISTGLGGSADTRTSNAYALGSATLQHQFIGILPSPASLHAAGSVLPLSDRFSSISMPEAWVRGAILIRANSFIRGHSAVRWELIERLVALLNANITPLVPLRGSVSASGDLSPLAYVAGTVMGIPSVQAFHGPPAPLMRNLVPSPEALVAHNLSPLPLLIKEHLAVMNGTAFSASVGALASYDAAHLAILALVLTALGTEALLGARGSFASFIHSIARPHAGQVEAASTVWDLLAGSQLAVHHEEDVTIDDDPGELRQNRYALRSAPQFIGPQLEDIAFAIDTLTVECNSTTDNPLVDGNTGKVYYGANFQAMAVTNAMEKTRAALHHIGDLLFAQCSELMNPSTNRGLPPSLAATDPSLDYHAKGLDIATAAYASELGFLASPVSHMKSAEIHNQSINSLALISARATITSVQIFSMLAATYLYSLCQAVDIRAMQAEFKNMLQVIVHEEMSSHFHSKTSTDLRNKVLSAMYCSLDNTSTMDAAQRMIAVAASSTVILSDAFAQSPDPPSVPELVAFRTTIASRAALALVNLRKAFLSGERGSAPAAPRLGRTRPVYEFVRNELGVRMHGEENRTMFIDGLGNAEPTIGQSVSLIYEAIVDGRMHGVIVGLF